MVKMPWPRLYSDRRSVFDRQTFFYDTQGFGPYALLEFINQDQKCMTMMMVSCHATRPRQPGLVNEPESAGPHVGALGLFL
jgi:hypothetical protein